MFQIYVRLAGVPVFALIFATWCPANSGAPGIGYVKRRAANVWVHVIQADIRRIDVNIAVATAAQGIGYRESWSNLVDRARPQAAVTGTYFDTATGIPIGTIVVDNTLIHRSPIGTSFAYSQKSGIKIDDTAPLVVHDFGGADTFLRAGPRLLTGGRISLSPRSEGFRDPSVFALRRRTALATTKLGKLIIAATTQQVSLLQWAAALKGIGAEDAMCLDGGSSTALYYGGKSRIVPRRMLTNIVVVYSSLDRYRERLPRLNRS